jgi:allophanate hydrolase subunit 1
MIRIDPDELHPDDLISRLEAIDEEVGDVRGFELKTRVVDVPVMMEDPWTHETLMRFRDRHQDPDATDLEYSARINGFDSKEDFIEALLGSPWLVTMIGFVPGLPWCYQLVPPEEQIEVPKYVRPRTYTPERAFGFGGEFAVVYSVEGAGGYQPYGLAPAPGDLGVRMPHRLLDLGLVHQVARHRRALYSSWTKRSRWAFTSGGSSSDPLEARNACSSLANSISPQHRRQNDRCFSTLS